MNLNNTNNRYGLISKAFHWVCALSILCLFGLGFWMVELSYYDKWYRLAPDYHKSIGVILAIVMAARVIWRWHSIAPSALPNHLPVEKIAASITHKLLYALSFFIMISGYLISTADNTPIDVFNWFSIPSLGELFNNQADIAGNIHKWLAYIVVGLALVHAIGALKHHFIDRDDTLKRML